MQLVTQLRKSTFIRHNLIFFVGSISMGALNYLYYPIMGRLLRPNSFGEVQALFSLFTQITIFLSVLGLLTVNIVANYDDIPKRNRIILELEKLALLVSVAVLLTSIIGGAALKTFFKFDSAVPFVMLALAVVVSVPLTFRNAYLRGMQSFGLVAVMGILTAAADLVASIVLVVTGFGTTGAIIGLVLAQSAAFCYAAFYARKQGFTEKLRSSLISLPDMGLILPELRYALLVLAGSLTITGLYSIDSIAVKHYFDAHTAGLYAGISTVARIIFFLTASIAQVLLPAVKLQNTPAQNKQVLRKSFLLLIIIGGSTWLVFALLSRFIIRILMGSTYLPYANLLPRLSLVLLLVSILNLFILYHMALRRYGIALIVIIGFVVTLCLVQIHHGSLLALIDSLLYGSLSMLALLGTWVGISKIKNIRITEA